MPLLTYLIGPERVPLFLRDPIRQALALLPLRPGGVRQTIEFILATHPSSSGERTSFNDPQSQGANISMEGLSAATRVLVSPSATISPEVYFRGIAPQLFALLDGEGGPEMVKVASFIIGGGILGSRARGAPGTSGWHAFVEPMIGAINPSCSMKQYSSGEVCSIMATASDVTLALQRLRALISSHPNPGLTKRLLGPLQTSLFALASWPVTDPAHKVQCCKPAWDLLKIYLQISSRKEDLDNLLKQLLFKGSKTSNGVSWKYKTALTGGVEIVSCSDEDLRSQGLNHQEIQVRIPGPWLYMHY